MQLSAEQIKVLIRMQIENYSRRIADLTPQIATLRSQPIKGSQELKRRLAYMEKELSDQQARLAALQDLQQVIQTTESLSSDEE
jgi:uncharacterized protein YeeX (DUF496 family)